MSKCLFLDRDGVIIHDKGYVSKVEQITFFPEIVPIIQAARSLNWKVVVVTNQAGVARGMFPLAAVEQVNAYLDQYLAQQQAAVDLWLVCPHHPSVTQCDCRKPRPGMLFQAQSLLGIELFGSIMIGDKRSDLFPVAGLTTFLLQQQYELANVEPAIVCTNHQQLLAALNEYWRKHGCNGNAGGSDCDAGV